MTWRLQEDHWLGEQLKCRSLRLQSTPGRQSTLDATWQDDLAVHIDSGSPLFLCAKVPVSNTADCTELQQCGLRVVDVNVTLLLQLSDCPARQDRRPADEIAVRQATGEDREATLAIAEQCFRYSRFHLDPCISDDNANRIKRSWIENYFSGDRGDRLYVALIDRQIAGFLAVQSTPSRTKGDSTADMVIDLIGVDSQFQGRGVGRALTSHFINDYRQCEHIFVGSQAANTAAIRLYQSMHFRWHEAKYVLHGHWQRRAS